MRQGAAIVSEISGADKLKRILVEKSFRYSDVPKFPLAAGGLSQFYVDCKMTLSDPEARKLLGDVVVNLLRDHDFDAVGGLELGAYPVAIAVSDGFYRIAQKKLKVFVIRKQPKPHGLQKWLEGDVDEGDRALIVDDVVTTGRSTLKAVERSRESGLIVEAVLALIDRDEGGRCTLEEAGVEFNRICSLTDLKRLQQERD